MGKSRIVYAGKQESRFTVNELRQFLISTKMSIFSWV